MVTMPVSLKGNVYRLFSNLLSLFNVTVAPLTKRASLPLPWNGTLLIKKPLSYTAFVKDLSTAKINTPMEDQV
jgi:hypothetical protein